MATPSERLSVANSIELRDARALVVARWAAVVAAIGAVSSPPLANIAVGVMVLAFFCATSALGRLRLVSAQPLARAALVVVAVMALSMLWSSAPPAVAWRELWGWRNFIWLVLSLAIFDEHAWKLRFAAVFSATMTLAAVACFIAWKINFSVLSDLYPGVLLRNHVTQSIAFAVAAFLCGVLSWMLPRQRVAWLLAFGVLVANVAFISYGRSGHLVLVVLVGIGVLGLLRGRVRIAALLGATAACALIVTASPMIQQRFKLGLDEFRDYQDSSVITSMGIRVVIWKTTAAMIRDRPWFGHGVGSYAPDYARYTQRMNSGWQAQPTQDPHNQYLYVLSDAGLLGLGVFAWFLFSVFRQPVRGVFRVVGIAFLCAWCITSLFSSHFHTFNEGHLIALLLGVFLANERAPYAPSLASTAASTSS